MTVEGVVRRDRLADLLAGPPQVRVLVAPSGFGKTTAVRSWAAAGDERPLVWVALGEGVASRQEFWRLVAATAARNGLVDTTGIAAVASAFDTPADPLPTVARMLESWGPTRLVLDAHEHLRELTTVIDDDILRLADAVAGLDVVVTTRVATHLVDDVVVLRGHVRVITEADLRFTVDEVARLLDTHAPHAIDAAARISDDTHGYPLGVRAVAHAIRDIARLPSFDSTAWQRLVAADLRSQIAAPELAEFVLDTSVPPYFDADLASQLTGPEARERLDELAWHGFGRWIPYAREHPVFQYVESVREVFREQLRATDPGRYERAAGMSAAWLHRHAEHDVALALAIEGRQHGLASRICDSLVLTNPAIFTTDTFERHLRQVPLDALPRHPVLAFARAMAYSTSPATRAAAAEFFDIAARHALDDADRLSPQELFRRHVGREVSLRYLGRSREAAAAAEVGLAHLDSMSAADRDELGDFVSMGLAVLAYPLFQIGDVVRAGDLLERAITSADGTWMRNYVAAFAVGFHAIDGRLPDARAAIAVIDGKAWPDHPGRPPGERRLPHVLGTVGQATMHLDAFDFDAAIAQYDEADWLMDTAVSWPFIAWTLMHARLGTGDAGPEALRITDELAGRPAGLGSNLGTAALLGALAILWLADGKAAKGHPLLRLDTACAGQLAPARLLYQLVNGDPTTAVRDVAPLLDEPGHTVRSRAAVETLGAAAALRAGNEQAAQALLEQASARHHRFGVRAHLMYVPAGDLVALRELARRADRPDCVTYLADPVVSPIAVAAAPAVLLTRRETEVLRVWATCRTRAEVAAALFVSPNTVKSQLTSAYRKLGVTTKDAAIQRAIELDLLHAVTPPRSG